MAVYFLTWERQICCNEQAGQAKSGTLCENLKWAPISLENITNKQL
jgi:hypothetical protein